MCLTFILISGKIKTRSGNVKEWCVLLVRKVSWGNCCFFSTSLQVFFINSRSENSCKFGVPMGEGELRVFVLHHLDHFQTSILDSCPKPINQR